jgi:CRP-like cAMP-binding protein
MEEVVFSKHDYLVTEGKICRHLYFLQHGALRGFYNLNGKEVTHWFAFEDDFVTSFHSFITQEAAVENIQLIEGSILWAISKSNLSTLMNQHHEIERLVRIAYEKYYLRLEERFVANVNTCFVCGLGFPGLCRGMMLYGLKVPAQLFVVFASAGFGIARWLF